MRPNRLGEVGEALAVEALEARGWRVVERTGRYAHYDVAAVRAGERVLWEVKTKRLTGSGEDRRHDIRPEGWRFWTEEASLPVRFLVVWLRDGWWDAGERALTDFRVTRAASGRWKLVDRCAPPGRLRWRLPAAWVAQD